MIPDLPLFPGGLRAAAACFVAAAMLGALAMYLDGRVERPERPAPDQAEGDTFDGWYPAHVLQCNRCRNGELCPSANLRLYRVRCETLRQWQSEQAQPGGKWLANPTHPGYWWRYDLDTKTTDDWPFHVVTYPEGLGYEGTDGPCTDWSGSWYLELDLRKPATWDGWELRPKHRGRYLNWADARGFMQVRSLFTDGDGGLIDGDTGRRVSTIGGLFLRLKPPVPTIRGTPPGSQGE